MAVGERAVVGRQGAVVATEGRRAAKIVVAAHEVVAVQEVAVVAGRLGEAPHEAARGARARTAVAIKVETIEMTSPRLRPAQSGRDGAALLSTAQPVRQSASG